jgi:hypothetical protein
MRKAKTKITKNNKPNQSIEKEKTQFGKAKTTSKFLLLKTDAVFVYIS